MAQRRIFNFGDTLTQDKVKTANSKLFPSIVYDGFDISVSGVDSVSLSPGTLMLPDGVVLQETLAITVSLLGLLGASATDFTIVALHVDQQQLGGVAATYNVISGFLSTYDNATVIGWIRYPGGSIALTEDMIIQAAKGPFDVYVSNLIDAKTKEHNVSPPGVTGTISSGGTPLVVQNDGSLIDSDVANINFIGNGVTAAPITSGEISVSVPIHYKVVRQLGPYSYIQAAVPDEDVVGQFDFDGSSLPTGSQVTMKILIKPVFNAVGWVRVRVYDLGPLAGVLPPVEVTANSPSTFALETDSSGQQFITTGVFSIEASGAGVPGPGKLVNTARMYEVTLEQDSIAGDTVYLGMFALQEKV